MWCGGRERKTPGYPIGISFFHQFFLRVRLHVPQCDRGLRMQLPHQSNRARSGSRCSKTQRRLAVCRADGRRAQRLPRSLRARRQLHVSGCRRLLESSELQTHRRAEMKQVRFGHVVIDHWSEGDRFCGVAIAVGFNALIIHFFICMPFSDHQSLRCRQFVPFDR